MVAKSTDPLHIAANTMTKESFFTKHKSTITSIALNTIFIAGFVLSTCMISFPSKFHLQLTEAGYIGLAFSSIASVVGLAVILAIKDGLKKDIYKERLEFLRASRERMKIE